MTILKAGTLEGDVVIAPPDVPHKFTATGSETARLICIHAAAKMQTEWLE